MTMSFYDLFRYGRKIDSTNLMAGRFAETLQINESERDKFPVRVCKRANRLYRLLDTCAEPVPEPMVCGLLYAHVNSNSGKHWMLQKMPSQIMIR